MCGRYTLSAGHEALSRAFLAEFGSELKAFWKPRYNIAPGSGIVAILEDRNHGGRRAEVFHWGLVPSWAKDPDIGHKLINARAETVADKPSYQDAFRYRRCLVPASGFYEWDRRSMPRQPWYFYPGRSGFLAMAGIWEHWADAGGSEILSIALITTRANKTVGRIHHRMPVILGPESWADWLNTDDVGGERPGKLLVPAGNHVLESHPVSCRVNKTACDDASLIEKSAPAPAGQLDLFQD